MEMIVFTCNIIFNIFKYEGFLWFFLSNKSRSFGHGSKPYASVHVKVLAMSVLDVCEFIPPNTCEYGIIAFEWFLTHTHFILEALNCQSYRAKFFEAVATAGKFDIQTKSGLKLSKSVPPKPSNTPLSQEIQETSHPIPIKTGWFVNIPIGNIMAKPR